MSKFHFPVKLKTVFDIEVEKVTTFWGRHRGRGIFYNFMNWKLYYAIVVTLFFLT